MYGAAVGFDILTQKFVGVGQYWIHTYDPVNRTMGNTYLDFCTPSAGGLGGLWNFGYELEVVLFCHQGRI